MIPRRLDSRYQGKQPPHDDFKVRVSMGLMNSIRYGSIIYDTRITRITFLLTQTLVGMQIHFWDRFWTATVQARSELLSFLQISGRGDYLLCANIFGFGSKRRIFWVIFLENRLLDMLHSFWEQFWRALIERSPKPVSKVKSGHSVTFVSVFEVDLFCFKCRTCFGRKCDVFDIHFSKTQRLWTQLDESFPKLVSILS